MAAGGVRIGHKLVKVEDRAEGGSDSHHYRENIFQAFHFEPPARKFIMKVREKAASFALFMASCYAAHWGNASEMFGESK